MSSNRSPERGDKSPPDEQSQRRQARDRQPTGDRDADAEVRGPVAEQDGDLCGENDGDVNSFLNGSPPATADQMESFGDADTQQDDSDGPVLSRRRSGVVKARVAEAVFGQEFRL